MRSMQISISDLHFTDNRTILNLIYSLDLLSMCHFVETYRFEIVSGMQLNNNPLPVHEYYFNTKDDQASDFQKYNFYQK